MRTKKRNRRTKNCIARNEELQTAKEELQPANEELPTTNDEMRGRNSELNQLNNDLVNLLEQPAHPDRHARRPVRIRRYTQVSEQLLNPIPIRHGRPSSDLKPSINVPDLEELLGKVIDSVEPMEREVQDQEGRWYSLRVHPYRTGVNRPDGAVLQLVNINQLNRSFEEVKQARDYAETIHLDRPGAAPGSRCGTSLLTANRAFFQTFRTSPDRDPEPATSTSWARALELPRNFCLIDGSARGHHPGRTGG